ncbi:hypothetical protein AAW51_2805 [Caldimonas brevitalea]|uniref:Uncharacterized protein n=2 Tax=Caldimonas brevitalea TaxID=413882 RepID=A0A0G3BQ64_9BURK|nr:hypothetical protein AAW51_2805 [Caldimonas brevitalea]
MEALLVLWREPELSWSADQVALRLYISGQEAVKVLDRLTALGLATKRAEGYGYAPSSPAVAASVDALARLYATHLIPITNLIHSKRDGRIREFAEAFKLRKKGD